MTNGEENNSSNSIRRGRMLPTQCYIYVLAFSVLHVKQYITVGFVFCMKHDAMKYTEYFMLQGFRL